MNTFDSSYIGQLRKVVGSRPLLIPGVRAVIEDTKGRILLQLRSDFGTWGIPGGSFEYGENAEEVLQREIQEETGLMVRDASVFGYASSPNTEVITFPNGDNCHFQSLLFHVSDFAGLLQADDESYELRWVEEVHLCEFEMLPNMAATLVAFRKYRKTGMFQLI